jgi:3-methyladenine DNA glycosylase AlkD
MATFHFIRIGQFEDTLALAARLLDDREDLIHKAVGWMLREVGNRDRASAERFLVSNYRAMPRTMLRYAIERFPAARRRAYLGGKV